MAGVRTDIKYPGAMGTCAKCKQVFDRLKFKDQNFVRGRAEADKSGITHFYSSTGVVLHDLDESGGASGSGAGQGGGTMSCNCKPCTECTTAVNLCQTALEKLDQLSARIDSLTTDIKNLDSKTDRVFPQIDSLESRINDLDSRTNTGFERISNLIGDPTAQGSPTLAKLVSEKCKGVRDSIVIHLKQQTEKDIEDLKEYVKKIYEEIGYKIDGNTEQLENASNLNIAKEVQRLNQNMKEEKQLLAEEIKKLKEKMQMQKEAVEKQVDILRKLLQQKENEIELLKKKLQGEEHLSDEEIYFIDVADPEEVNMAKTDYYLKAELEQGGRNAANTDYMLNLAPPSEPVPDHASRDQIRLTSPRTIVSGDVVDKVLKAIGYKLIQGLGQDSDWMYYWPVIRDATSTGARVNQIDRYIGLLNGRSVSVNLLPGITATDTSAPYWSQTVQGKLTILLREARSTEVKDKLTSLQQAIESLAGTGVSPGLNTDRTVLDKVEKIEKMLTEDTHGPNNEKTILKMIKEINEVVLSGKIDQMARWMNTMYKRVWEISNNVADPRVVEASAQPPPPDPLPRGEPVVMIPNRPPMDANPIDSESSLIYGKRGLVGPSCYNDDIDSIESYSSEEEDDDDEVERTVNQASKEKVERLGARIREIGFIDEVNPDLVQKFIMTRKGVVRVIDRSKLVNVRIPFEIGDHKRRGIDCMIDTGASISLARRWMFPEYAWKPCAPIYLKSVTNHTRPLEWKAEMRAHIGKAKVILNFYEYNEQAIDVIIGNDNIDNAFDMYSQNSKAVFLTIGQKDYELPRLSEVRVHANPRQIPENYAHLGF